MMLLSSSVIKNKSYLTIYHRIFLFGLLWLQCCSSHTLEDQGKRHIDFHVNHQDECPPNTISSPEEVGHYCHAGQKRHFMVRNNTYQCYGAKNRNTICRGKIHPDQVLPECSQASIATCQDEIIYTNFNNQSQGPCLYRENDVIWHSARCRDGKFSCWDPTLGVWCQGTVENDEILDFLVTCPPLTVYSIHEAIHYCSQSGLATNVDPDDFSSYACSWKDGTTACKGKIDPRLKMAQACSHTINACEDLAYVCQGNLAKILTCDNEEGTFECWDKKMDSWCVGQVVESVGGRKESVNFSVGFMTVAVVAMVLRRALRDGRSKAHYRPSIPVDVFAYHAVSDETKSDLELTFVTG